MTNLKRSAASGEQSAIGGYEAQYEYSACEVYRWMSKGTFSGFTIGSAAADIFDDLFLHIGEGIIGFQIKTETDAKSVNLYTELLEGDLFVKIARSWKSIKSKYPKTKINLKYLFGGYFSKSDAKLASKNAVGSKHSAAFAKFLRESDLTDEIVKSSIWYNAITTLQQKSELTDTEFLELLNCLELHDHEELIRNKIENFPADIQPKLARLKALFPELVGEKRGDQFFSEDQIVRRLGWTKIAQKHVHEFPLTDDVQDNRETRENLLTKLLETDSGYISLIGPPGTGKSTLLQNALHSTPTYSVLRYLAFVPDERHGLGRAEAGAFLNDLVSSLNGIGLWGTRHSIDALDSLRAELEGQLLLAGKRFLETGRKTIIVIDGLDHVPREENPSASFLRELPHPTAIPNGVLFVLGTQRVDLSDLNLAVRQQAQSPERRVEIAPLPRFAVLSMLEKSKPSIAIDHDEFYEACGGHPLTTRYFIEALKFAGTDEEANRILSQKDGIGRKLEEIYSKVWQALSLDETARQALGLLARAEGRLTLHQIASIHGDKAVESMNQKAGFLLSKNKNNRVGIFHNSFRLHLLDKTGRRFDEIDLDLDRAFNQSLAKIAENSDSNDEQYWYQLRYHSRAGNEQKVLDIGQPDYFRRSLATFRPSDEIYGDLRLTYAAVKQTRSRSLLLNKLLIEKEIDYRLDAVSQVDMAGLFLDLEDKSQAIEHAMVSNGSGTGWYQLVDQLCENGELTDARRVFEANEPLEAMFQKEAFDYHQNREEINNWLFRAHRFRPLDQLLSFIDSIKLADRFENEDDVKVELRIHLGRGIIHFAPDTNLEALTAALGIDIQDSLCLFLEALLAQFHKKNNDGAMAHLRYIQSQDSIFDLHQSWIFAIARVAFKLGEIDFAKRLIANVTNLSIGNDRSHIYGKELIDLVDSIFSKGVLANLLELKESKDDSKVAAGFWVFIERNIVELAQSQAFAMQGKSDAALISLQRVVNFFSLAKPNPADHDDFRFYGLFNWIAKTIVQVGRHLEPSDFEKVITTVDERTSKSGNNFSKSEAFKFSWSLALFKQDKNSNRAKQRLDSIREVPRYDQTPHEVVEFKIKLAKAYHMVGFHNLSSEVLSELHFDTFGYSRPAKKEPQYEFWQWAFSNACGADPANSDDRASVFGRFILGMGETEGDGTARRLVSTLLAGCEISPKMLAGLAERLMDSNLTSWTEIASGLLSAIGKSDACLAEPVLVAFGRLVVPFHSSSANHNVLECLPKLKLEMQKSSLDKLVSAITIWCPQSERVALLKSLFKIVPNPQIDLQQSINEAEAQLTYLERAKHGASTSKQESYEQEYDAKSLADLVALDEGKDKYGSGADYAYARVAETIARQSNITEIDDFIQARPQFCNEAKFLIACAETSLNVGNTVDARRYFSMAEKAAFSGHWSSFMGGQKLRLQELRVLLDNDKGRNEGFDVLINELASGLTFGSSLFLSLDRVLELVSVDPNFAELWSETESHLKEYREYRLAEDIAKHEDIQTYIDLFAFLLAKAFGFSCPEVLDHARATTFDLAHLDIGGVIIPKLFQLLLETDCGPREVAAVMYKLRFRVQLKEVLIEQAKKLRSHDDFVVSSLSHEVLHHFDELGVDDPKIELPSFYDLAPSGNRQAYNFEPPSGLSPTTKPLWTDDPWSQTSSLRSVLKSTVKATRFDMEVLRRRCAQFLSKIGGQSKCGPTAEDAVRMRLEQLDLKFPWRRLHPMFQLRAFGMMINELVKAQEIDTNVLPILWEEMGGPSLEGYDLPTEAQPSWLEFPKLPSRDSFGIQKDAWLDAAEEDLFTPISEHWFVLAEVTQFKARVWRELAETVRVSLPNIAAHAGRDDNLQGVPNLFSLDSLEPLYDANESKLVCKLFQPLFGEIRAPTMTICPYVADQLKWVRSSSNPFELLDQTGNLMARTQQWANGTFNHDNFEAEQFGKGHVLLVSSLGLARLKGLVGEIRVNVQVTRTYTRESGGEETRSLKASV